MSEATIDRTINRTNAAAHDMAHQVGDAANQAGAAVREAGRKIGAAASDLGQHAYRKGADATQDVARRVEEQPLSAVMVAAGIGFVAGLLFSRR